MTHIIIKKSQKTAYIFLLLVSVLVSPSYGAESAKKSLSSYLNHIRGDSFNLIVIDPLITDSTKPKTNSAIIAGFNNQIASIDRVVKRSNYQVRLKMPSFNQETDVADELNKMLKSVDEFIITCKRTLPEQKPEESPDVDESKMEFDETQFRPFGGDLCNGQSLKDLIESSLLKIAAVYQKSYAKVSQKKELLRPGDILIPIVDRDKKILEVVTPHAVFGEVFNPETEGRRHIISMRIFLFIMGSDGMPLDPMIKEVNRFEWNRNDRYIAAVTGKGLREVLSNAIGTTIR